jgi:hypothetical protein
MRPPLLRSGCLHHFSDLLVWKLEASGLGREEFPLVVAQPDSGVVQDPSA